MGREEVEVINSGESVIISMIHEQTQKGSTIKHDLDEDDGINSKVSSDQIHPDELDDDSPFVLKIILDPGFLSNLGDPNMVEPSELMGPPNRMHELVKNKKFEDMIKSEVFNLFYRNKVTGLTQGMTPDQSVRNQSVFKLEQDRQLSSIKKSESDNEVKQKNMYEVINEESSNDDSAPAPKELSGTKSPANNESVVIEAELNHHESKDTIEDRHKMAELLHATKFDSAQLPVDELKIKATNDLGALMVSTQSMAVQNAKTLQAEQFIHSGTLLGSQGLEDDPSSQVYQKNLILGLHGSSKNVIKNNTISNSKREKNSIGTS